MDIQIRKQLEQLKYIKDKLEYIEYDKALGCYIEKQDGLPTGVAAWVNGAFYGFEQAATDQAVFEYTTEELESTANFMRGVCFDPRLHHDIRAAMLDRISRIDDFLEAQEPSND